MVIIFELSGLKISNPNPQNLSGNLSESTSILKDFFQKHNQTDNSTTRNESVLKEFINNKDNYLNNTSFCPLNEKYPNQISDRVDVSAIEPNSLTQSYISVNLLDFERNLYTETNYSLETLRTTKSFIQIDDQIKDPINLNLKKFLTVTPEEQELKNLTEINSSHNDFSKLLRNRKDKLKVVSKFWDESLNKTLRSIST